MGKIDPSSTVLFAQFQAQPNNSQGRKDGEHFHQLFNKLGQNWGLRFGNNYDQILRMFIFGYFGLRGS